MKHQVLLQDYQNLKKDFEQLEIKRNGKESDFTNVLDDLNKMEVLKVNLENRLENLEKENKDLMANEISLSSDLKKKSSDYIAFTRKLNAEHLEHQKTIREMSDFCCAVCI